MVSAIGAQVCALESGDEIYLVGLVGSGGGNLALVTRSELSEVTMVVALPGLTVSIG